MEVMLLGRRAQRCGMVFGEGIGFWVSISCRCASFWDSMVKSCVEYDRGVRVVREWMYVNGGRGVDVLFFSSGWRE